MKRENFLSCGFCISCPQIGMLMPTDRDAEAGGLAISGRRIPKN
jgi:hypothetical protein